MRGSDVSQYPVWVLIIGGRALVIHPPARSPQIDPADVFSLMGVYPGFAPSSLPAVPGLDGVGVVDKTGSGASKFKPG